jgi:aminotransferase
MSEQRQRDGRISDRAAATPPSGIRRYFELAAEMDEVISLGVGEPDFSAPWAARMAAIAALEQGKTSYTANRGLRELRGAVAEYLTRFDLAYDPRSELLVTTGASEAVDLAMRALVDPGDVVAIPQPTYISYVPTAELAGADVLPVETSAATGFEVTTQALTDAGAQAADLLILCYPNNPTGAVMDRDALMPVAEFAVEHDITVVADEIYAELRYDGRHTSIAALPEMRERTVVINGFSKAYAMTGLRLGYAAGPAALIGAMNRIHQYTMLSAPTTAQHAALGALTASGDVVSEMRSAFDKRRRYVVDRFEELGMSTASPRGAFYVFPRCPPDFTDDARFAEELLTAEQVAVVPGRIFGVGGAGHCRVSYASSMRELREALDRIEAFLAAH